MPKEVLKLARKQLFESPNENTEQILEVGGTLTSDTKVQGTLVKPVWGG